MIDEILKMKLPLALLATSAVATAAIEIEGAARSSPSANLPRKLTTDTDPSPQSQSQAQSRSQVQSQAQSQAQWYPNWKGGTNACLPDLADEPAPSFIVQQNLMKESQQECCDDYYWWDLQVCLAGGPLLVLKGDAVDVGVEADVDAGGGASGGASGSGGLDSGGGLQSDATESDADADVSGGLDIDINSGGSAVGGDGGGAAAEKQQLQQQRGSLDWYADYSLFKCVQDCPDDSASSTSSPNPNSVSGDHCGGLIPTTSTSASTSDSNIDNSNITLALSKEDDDNDNEHELLLFPTSEECCVDQYEYLAPGVCVASSTGTNYEGSMEYYVDYTNGRCVQDCVINKDDASSTTDGICGGIAMESSTEVHANVTACCQAHLSDVIDPLLCETRSTKGGVEEGTFRLYPDVMSGTCVIDHDPSNTIVCSIGYACKLIPSSSYISKLYHVSPKGVEECCAEGLTHVNPTYCKTRTMGIVSRKWFVNYDEKVCHQDCDDEMKPNCSINNDHAATYYSTTKECCQSKLGYLNQAKCLADSTGAPYGGSSEYYVDYKESKCVRDCPIINGGDCGGVIEDSNTGHYGNAMSCCESGLSYMDMGLCQDRSDSTGTGTGKYYPSEENAICVKDTPATPCPSGETCERVNGWLSTLYNTAAECCESDVTLPSVNTVYCKAFSTGIATNKWFRHDGNRCANHCTDVGSSAECDIPIDPSGAYYDTAQECCTAELNYLIVGTCEELSARGGILSDLVGTNEFYVDWMHQACVKNCPEGNESGDESTCGGIAGATWITLFSDVEDCCDSLYYIDRANCLNRD